MVFRSSYFGSGGVYFVRVVKEEALLSGVNV